MDNKLIQFYLNISLSKRDAEASRNTYVNYLQTGQNSLPQCGGRRDPGLVALRLIILEQVEPRWIAMRFRSIAREAARKRTVSTLKNDWPVTDKEQRVFSFFVFLSACFRSSSCCPVALPVCLLLSLLPPLSRCPILQEQVLIATKYSGEWPTYGTASLDNDVGAGHEMTKTTTTTATMMTTMIEKMRIGAPICTYRLKLHGYATSKVTARDKGKKIK